MNERMNVLQNRRSRPKRIEERDRWEKGRSGLKRKEVRDEGEKGRDLEIEGRKWKEGKGNKRQGEGRNMIEIEGK